METEPQPEEPQAPPRRRWLKRILVPVVIVIVGVLASKIFIATKPEVKKRQPQPAVTLVETVAMSPLSTNVTVSAMGTVVPSRAITLRSRVGGEVVSVSPRFVEGAFVSEGEELLRIDPTDFEIALTRAEAALVESTYEVSLEEGRQKVAQREWKMMKPEGDISDEERSLALREPHLKRVRAMRASAEAALRSAQLNLERATIRAPFNAVITSRGTELGAQVSVQDALAELASSDTGWVRTAVPQDRLPWLLLPTRDGKEGSKAIVSHRSGDTTARKLPGRLVRLLGAVEEQGRMSELLVEVEDPFGLREENVSGGPLLLGSYVHVDLEGKTLDNVFALSRSALRDNDQVWLVGDQGELLFNDTDVIWRGPDEVLIGAGLTEGALLVVSDIPAPIEGMKLTRPGDKMPAQQPMKPSGHGHE